MSRRRKNNPRTEILFISVFLIFTIATTSTTSGRSAVLFITLIALMFIAMALAVLAFLTYQQRQRQKLWLNQLDLSGVDKMSGSEFEEFLAILLPYQGYKVLDVKHSKDGGVDLVASKGKERYSIQAKRYSTKVNRRAITDAVAGMSFRDCTQAMAITNYYFTIDAKNYAKKVNCALVERPQLAKWLAQSQKDL